ncbi:hypothetical protein AB9E06_21620 [Rhizobium leguminosarum]|uniref:pPIWI-associating nuclease domain-containing protein n=1 Tax=Rhizobium leguminosarum TaxID=384 RepID=UPI003F9619EC
MLPSATVALAETLSAKLPDEFSRKVLAGSLGAAWDSANPIRANLFAAGLRELATYILHHLAPDELVKACPWYQALQPKREAEAKKKGGAYVDRPTRVDRMVYATQGGLSDDFLEEHGLDVHGDHKTLREMVDQLSKYTHMRPGSLVEGDEAVSTFMDDAIRAVILFHRTIETVRSTVVDIVAESINEEADTTLNETIVQELDELSSHTTINEVIADDIRVTSLGPAKIEFSVKGTVYVQLNYGSRSDFNRGDGASMRDKYPFSVRMGAAIADFAPYTLEPVAVDNSSFYE